MISTKTFTPRHWPPTTRIPNVQRCLCFCMQFYSTHLTHINKWSSYKTSTDCQCYKYTEVFRANISTYLTHGCLLILLQMSIVTIVVCTCSVENTNVNGLLIILKWKSAVFSNIFILPSSRVCAAIKCSLNTSSDQWALMNDFPGPNYPLLVVGGWFPYIVPTTVERRV